MVKIAAATSLAKPNVPDASLSLVEPAPDKSQVVRGHGDRHEPLAENVSRLEHVPDVLEGNQVLLRLGHTASVTKTSRASPLPDLCAAVLQCRSLTAPCLEFS